MTNVIMQVLLIASAVLFLLAGVFDHPTDTEDGKSTSATSLLSGYILLVIPESILIGIKWYWMFLINILFFSIICPFIRHIFKVNKQKYPSYLNRIFSICGFITLLISVSIIHSLHPTIFGWIFITISAVAILASFIRIIIDDNISETNTSYNSNIGVVYGTYYLSIAMWIGIIVSAFYFTIDTNNVYGFLSGFWHGICFAPNLLRKWVFDADITFFAANYKVPFLYNLNGGIGILASSALYIGGIIMSTITSSLCLYSLFYIPFSFFKSKHS